MKKKVFSLIFCLSGISMFPSVVLGEGLLSDTVNNVVQQGVEQTAITEAIEEMVSPTIENVVNEPANTVVNTVPAEAEKVVEQVSENVVNEPVNTIIDTVPTVAEKALDYVEKTTSEVGKSVENIPAVAPVVKKAEQTVNNVIIKVNGTVKKTVNMVPAVSQKINDKTGDVIDKVGNLPTKPVNTDGEDPTIETSKPVEETLASSISWTIESINVVDKKVIENVEPLEISSEESIERGILEEKTFKGTIKQVSRYDRKVDSPLKQSGEKRNHDFIVTTTPATSAMQNSSSNGGATSASLFDGYSNIGIFSSFDVMQAATEKLWYHKNSYAIIQWFHTPLRKPPEHSPFLYVM